MNNICSACDGTGLRVPVEYGSCEIEPIFCDDCGGKGYIAFDVERDWEDRGRPYAETRDFGDD